MFRFMSIQVSVLFTCLIVMYGIFMFDFVIFICGKLLVFFEELEHTYVIVSIKLWLINRLNAVYLNGNMLLTTDNKHHIYIFYNPPEAK